MRSTRFASRLLVAVCAAAALLAAGKAPAAPLVDVKVVNRSTGEYLTAYRHAGKLYVAGTPGDKYAIDLRNRSGKRLMTVISVDGVNVLTGQTAAAAQSGYVLDPGHSYAITGWRKSMEEVAQFVFTALPDSYAARTGRPQNVGVIGVAVFRPRIKIPAAPAAVEPWRGAGNSASRERAETAEMLARQQSDMAASKAESGIAAPPARRADDSDARALRDGERLGTGHGERENSPTQWTDFVRASDTPDEIVTIHYDSRANLIARGIIRGPRVAEPNPFPAGFGFVPDPRS